MFYFVRKQYLIFFAWFILFYLPCFSIFSRIRCLQNWRVRTSSQKRLRSNGHQTGASFGCIVFIIPRYNISALWTQAYRQYLIKCHRGKQSLIQFEQLVNVVCFQKRWLNEYNAKIRQYVGDELKRQGNMQAFYWMMNKTRHVREYTPEEEYRAARGSGNRLRAFLTITVPAILLGLTVFGSFLRWLLWYSACSDL